MSAKEDALPLGAKLLLSTICSVALLSAGLILNALATDVSAMFGKAVDFYDVPLTPYYILRSNLMGVISLYYILRVYEEAQTL